MNNLEILEAIQEKHKLNSKCLGNIFLLSANNALQFIDDCTSAGLLLAGVSGFIITENSVFQEDQEASNDIADSPMPLLEFIQLSKSMITNNNLYWYEIVFEDTYGVSH